MGLLAEPLWKRISVSFNRAPRLTAVLDRVGVFPFFVDNLVGPFDTLGHDRLEDFDELICAV